MGFYLGTGVRGNNTCVTKQRDIQFASYKIVMRARCQMTLVERKLLAFLNDTFGGSCPTESVKGGFGVATESKKIKISSVVC